MRRTLTISVWLGSALTITGCAKGVTPETSVDVPAVERLPAPPVVNKTDPDEELKRSAKDLEEYTKELKTKVPFDTKAFQKSGMKAESYVKDDANGHFKELVIRVDPIYLTDKLTGQSTKYTRAKFTRNNPRPFRPGTVPQIFEWAKVEMMP